MTFLFASETGSLKGTQGHFSSFLIVAIVVLVLTAPLLSPLSGHGLFKVIQL
jgi:hypothetical protein